MLRFLFFLAHLHLASVIVGDIVHNFYILLFSFQSETTEPIGTKPGRKVHWMMVPLQSLVFEVLPSLGVRRSHHTPSSTWSSYVNLHFNLLWNHRTNGHQTVYDCSLDGPRKLWVFLLNGNTWNKQEPQRCKKGCCLFSIFYSKPLGQYACFESFPFRQKYFYFYLPDNVILMEC